MELAPGTMVTPNVRLVGQLGRGGMGSIWVADHLGLEVRVVVKFISPRLIEYDPSLRERFKIEASIGARLRSTHVVQTFDHGVMNDTRPYIVMELLEGATLTAVVEGQGRRSLRQVSMIIEQVSKVLHRAHELGIVHRDIKPDNIFMAESDYDMLVKVLDFGIAKQTRASREDMITKTGVVVGSPEFMSPEQAISSKDVDHRTDLFSLGVVAYYALSGELPFDDGSDTPEWMRLTSGSHVPISQRMPELPRALDEWFEQALQSKPARRFQSAREMADAFAQAIGDASDLGSSISDGLNIQAPTGSSPAPPITDEGTLMMRPDQALPDLLAGQSQPPAQLPETPPWEATLARQERGMSPILLMVIGAVFALVVVVVAVIVVAG